MKLSLLSFVSAAAILGGTPPLGVMADSHLAAPDSEDLDDLGIEEGSGDEGPSVKGKMVFKMFGGKEFGTLADVNAELGTDVTFAGIHPTLDPALEDGLINCYEIPAVNILDDTEVIGTAYDCIYGGTTEDSVIAILFVVFPCGMFVVPGAAQIPSYTLSESPVQVSVPDSNNALLLTGSIPTSLTPYFYHKTGCFERFDIDGVLRLAGAVNLPTFNCVQELYIVEGDYAGLMRTLFYDNYQ